MKKLIFGLAFVLTGLSAPSALASSSNGSPPPAYTGGAAVVKVLYPADGSTVTITATGAVVKQSPGYTAYREGWINTADICSINVAGDLVGKLRPGSTNPYGSTQASTNCNGSTSSNTSAPTTSTPTTSSSASATSSATVITAGSQPTTQQPAQPTTQTTAPQVSAPQTSASTQTTDTSSAKAVTLPNTGPGAVMFAFGSSSMIGTIGHFLFTRRKILN